MTKQPCIDGLHDPFEMYDRDYAIDRLKRSGVSICLHTAKELSTDQWVWVAKHAAHTVYADSITEAINKILDEVEHEQHPTTDQCCPV